MRRRMLDMLRAERLDEAEDLVEHMDDIVGQLAELDSPDGMTNGLRHTTDVARSLMTFAATYDRLRQEGPISPKTGEPHSSKWPSSPTPTDMCSNSPVSLDC